MPRITLGTPAKTTAVLAVNFGIYRAAVIDNSSRAGIIVGLLPAASVLIWTLLSWLVQKRAGRKNPRALAWALGIGIPMALISLLAFRNADLILDRWLNPPIHMVIELLQDRIPSVAAATVAVYFLSTAWLWLCLSGPLLLHGWWLARKTPAAVAPDTSTVPGAS